MHYILNMRHEKGRLDSHLKPVWQLELELTLRSATFSENVLSRKNKQTNKKTQIKTEISLVVAMH